MSHLYSDPAKRVSSFNIWSHLREPALKNYERVLFLPGPTSHEVELVSKYFPMESLILCEMVPARMAHCTRQTLKRNLTPGYKFTGKLSELALELDRQDECVIARAHLDFCGIASGDAKNELSSLIAHDLLARKAKVAVTVLSGRDPIRRQRASDDEIAGQMGYIKDEVYSSLSNGDTNRLLALTKPFHNSVDFEVLASGKYFNSISHQPMVWFVFEFNHHRCYCHGQRHEKLHAIEYDHQLCKAIIEQRRCLFNKKYSDGMCHAHSNDPHAVAMRQRRIDEIRKTRLSGGTMKRYYGP